MSRSSRKRLVDVLLDEYGRTISQELRIPVERNTPAPLFQLLCASLLLSARIPAGNAARAARALIDAGLTTPKKMAAATWQDRVDVLTAHGYKRYDESASRMLGETAQRLLAEYRGDLRRLREDAGRDAAREKKLLTRFKGIGDTGADIFLREVQVAWQEAHPYADRRVLDAASRLGLPASATELGALVPRDDFARFVTALIRVDLQDAAEEVRARAARN